MCIRDRDYYCHTAFEFTTNELGSQGTVLAGGRYDGLSKMLGGPDVPGVGWAAGIERLALMAQSEFVNKTDVVLIGQSENIKFLLLPIMKKLVQNGIKTEIIYNGNLSKKLKRANKIKDLNKISENFGAEIDIRTSGSNLILSHDPFVKGDTLENYLENYNHKTLVLNLKEAGIEKILIRKYIK